MGDQLATCWDIALNSAPSPLRVLHVYRTYFPETQGGLEESIRQLCLATQPLGVENTVFCLAKQPHPPELLRPEGRLLRARSWAEPASCNIGGLGALRLLRSAARTADLIQMHYPWPFADLLLPWARLAGQPLVVTYVSDVVRQRWANAIYSPLRQQLLRSASRVVASSPQYARTSPVLQRWQDKLSVIAHCLGDLPAPDVQRLQYWRERVGSGFFLFVGVMRYYKGLQYLLQAAALAHQPLVVLGDGPCGPELRHQGDGLEQVQFVGALSDADKLALLHLCRALVLPSHLRAEAFGMVLLEAAQMSKPLITCEIGTGTSNINLDGCTGLVVPPADAAALALALQRLAADDALCARMGAAARQRWQAHFSPAVVGPAYRALYDDLLALQPAHCRA